MSDSILISTKKALDVPENYDVFDGNIIMHINSVFSTLNQLGIGPVDGFSIEDEDPTWTQYLGGNPRLNLVKSYMYLRVRQLFDPPATSFLLAAIDAQIKELEWRINVEREYNSTLLAGEHKKITGNLGDEHRIKIANPAGKTTINSTGTYTAEFVSRTGRRSPATLDVSHRADGYLYLTVVIKDGSYIIRRMSPQKTILTIDVRVV